MDVDVLLSPPEIASVDEVRIRDSVVVVFDVLRATSSMITGLQHGARGFHVVDSTEDALAWKREHPEGLIAGERFGDKPSGFDLGNSPESFRTTSGRVVVLTTTNGTVAIRRGWNARRLYIASLLNLRAVAERLNAEAPERLTIMCAGTFETFALEDAYAAGRLVRLLKNPRRTDAATAVEAIASHFGDDGLSALASSRNGQALISRGWEGDVKWCARESVFDVVGMRVSDMICAEATA